MAAKDISLSVDQGSNFNKTLTIQDDAEPPAPIDITGYTFKAQARAGYGKPDVAFAFGFTVGKVDMHLLPVDTTSLALKADTAYVYDVEMTSASGAIRRLFQGVVTVSPEATK